MLRPWRLNIEISRTANKAVYLQIADAVIEAIKSGKLRSGDALPGGRRLAENLKVNRNTVIEALEILIAEGWLISRERKGTFVSEKFRLSEQAKLLPVKPTTAHIYFDDGLPDARLAPMKELSRVYRQLLNRNARWQMLGYNSGLGDEEFREAAAQMLNFNRGMNVSSSQICITRGSQMAMFLSAQCLIEEGDVVFVENPGYKPAWRAFSHAGAELVPVRVDEEGIDVDELEQLLYKTPNIKAVYLTPHHQFPTTVTLSTSRRIKLIELSNQFGFTIIEDDYDNEFQFDQRAFLPVSSFENAHNYIYIGTLSKMVAPVLRMGFLVSDAEFVKKTGSLRKIIDVQGDSIMEQAILQLIKSGEIRRHMKRAIAAYKVKRDFFESLLAYHLRDKVEFKKPDGGLAFWIKPRSGVDLFELNKVLLSKGVQINTPDKFSFKEHIYGIRMGFASLSESQLEEGLISIAKVI